MNPQSSPVDVDGIFEQALNQTDNGPVPKAVLYQLLSAAEAVFREALQCDEPDTELIGLRLGYDLLDKAELDTEQQQEFASPEMYWVGWGWHPSYDEVIPPYQEHSKKNDYAELDAVTSNLSTKTLQKLISQIQKYIVDHTPVYLLKDKIIHPFVFGHTVKLNSYQTHQLNLNASTREDLGENVGRTIFKMQALGCLWCYCPRGNSIKTGRSTPDNPCARPIGGCCNSEKVPD